MRADAQRNLEALLGAAKECFSEQGLDVSADVIARRAGVGHGTVYRRFPSKEALLEAVLVRELELLIATADDALADPDAGAGFERFFRTAAELYGRNRALLEGGFERCRDLPEKRALVERGERLVRRAQKAGYLRRELRAEDVFALVPAASSYPDVIVAGLRAPLS